MLVRAHFQRIFALKITRSTFREVQNIILAGSEGNPDLANKLLEILFLGQMKEGVVTDKAKETLDALVKDFSMLIRLAKEVQDRGDVVNLIVSDAIEQKDSIGFLHRLKKVDGEEFSFVTDPTSTINLLHHFVTRIEEMEQSELAKEELRRYNPIFTGIRDFFDEILQKYPPLPESATPADDGAD
ncbi:MAG: hypothetical protein K0S74_677 [Chlamydiales bacterium]|nr:hypothetical protein [Chlamydiales bacterium]